MVRDRLVRDLKMFGFLKEMVFVLCWANNGLKEGSEEKWEPRFEKRKKKRKRKENYTYDKWK